MHISRKIICLSLKSSHVRIKEDVDELSWCRNLVGGGYSPKLGYKVFKEDDLDVEEERWFKGVWKFKSSIKAKVLVYG